MFRSTEVIVLFTAAAALLRALGAGLPVKRVILYKNRVGYFKHLGVIRGNQDLTIPFTSGQLNDVLKGTYRTGS